MKLHLLTFIKIRLIKKELETEDAVQEKGDTLKQS
jgi:hypothetical protein